jgi:hypothetical protein
MNRETYADFYAKALTLTYAEIDAIGPALAAMTVNQLRGLGVEVGHCRTKARIVKALVQRIKERKGMAERCAFR